MKLVSLGPGVVTVLSAVEAAVVSAVGATVIAPEDPFWRQVQIAMAGGVAFALTIAAFVWTLRQGRKKEEREQEEEREKRAVKQQEQHDQNQQSLRRLADHIQKLDDLIHGGGGLLVESRFTRNSRHALYNFLTVIVVQMQDLAHALEKTCAEKGISFDVREFDRQLVAALNDLRKPMRGESADER